MDQQLAFDKGWLSYRQAVQGGEKQKQFFSFLFRTILLCLISITTAIAFSANVSAHGIGGGSTDPLAGLLTPSKLRICKDQTYGLCAGAKCFVFDSVAYCSCGVHKGKSISSAFKYDLGDVCSVNAEGVDNGYMVSTFSLPKGLRAPGDQALYTCPWSSTASYAKCDGGICFRSTQGRSFPNLGQLNSDQLVCSCPIKKANPAHGLEIIGPYPCQQDFFKECERIDANGQTGSTLYDGTSRGATLAAILLLYGKIPPLNKCTLGANSNLHPQ